MLQYTTKLFLHEYIQYTVAAQPYTAYMQIPHQQHTLIGHAFVIYSGLMGWITAVYFTAQVLAVHDCEHLTTSGHSQADSFRKDVETDESGI